MRIKNSFLNVGGFVGLVGLLGFRYFATGDPNNLFFFSFFAFFSFFILGGISFEYPDERWKDTSRRAATIGFWVAACSVFLVGFIASSAFGSRELVILAAALGWIASLFSYAIAFRAYEAS